ncbi:MAG: amidohydrolase [Salinivirgaceae bacterium]|jgi:omega-amidase|nr:amidohydrolase [Salinivirgaceae bacterium]
MQQKLTLTLVQPDILWEQPQKNLDSYRQKIEQLNKKPDIVVLPEMFTTGFSMNPQKVAEGWPGQSLRWMIDQSVLHQTVICGSLMVKVNDRYYNRFVWVEPDGTQYFYDKRHLFQMGGEHEVYSAGSEQLFIDYKGWRIAPFICYDLRFPVWSRNASAYDLALYVANWPAARAAVWKKLLMARAIENQCFVAGVNRVGTDGRGLKYSGDSMLVNARGEVQECLTPGIDEVKTVTIDREELSEFRKKFPVLTDADNFELKP